jgi:diacylglycerol O-acyltransferase
VSRVHCDAPYDLEAQLVVAADAVTRPLRPDRPLWCAVIVSGPLDQALAVVVVLHHVVTDGVGGLSLLTR